MVVRDPVTDEYVGLKCNVCPTMAPPAEEIMKGHGLNNMGWHCLGGNHLCPDHHPAMQIAGDNDSGN